MFITPAYAQTGADGGSFLLQFAPFLLIFLIIYMLIIRPQQRRQKEHREMVTNVRRGDTVTMTGGVIGKVTKVIDDAEAMIEVAEGVRIKIVKSMISDVRTKGEPVKGEPVKGDEKKK